MKIFQRLFSWDKSEPSLTVPTEQRAIREKTQESWLYLWWCEIPLVGLCWSFKEGHDAARGGQSLEFDSWPTAGHWVTLSTLPLWVSVSPALPWSKQSLPCWMVVTIRTCVCNLQGIIVSPRGRKKPWMVEDGAFQLTSLCIITK